MKPTVCTPAAGEILDVVGIGIGPFNLSLAALLAEAGYDRTVFLERKPRFSWHPGMLLEGTTLQVPFLADLVSLVAPTSRFSFLNYLQVHDRLYKFLFFENFHIPRREYEHYCQWVSDQLPSLRFGSEVMRVDVVDGCYRVTVRVGNSESIYYARNLVLGTGTQPWLPACLHTLAQRFPQRVMHTADYAQRFDIAGKHRVLVLGSGQSAAEVVQALLARQGDDEAAPFELNWFTRSPGFLAMEYSKLGLEHFTPDYTAYFHGLTQNVKDRVVPKQGLFYKGISFKTISAIYDCLYHRSVGGAPLPVQLRALCELREVELTANGRLDARFAHLQTGHTFSIAVDAIIAGSGYRYTLPSFLDGLGDCVQYDDMKRLKIDAGYRVEHRGPGQIFMQNGELHTHGIGAPDLGLGAWRAASIANQIAGRELYRLSSRVAFQTFGAEADKAASTAGTTPSPSHQTIETIG
ncbi:lysine N(6)-hydroxylase/L-ornithine N(5)-oxygenase family protein [Ralstonia solanacearum]|uniref:lysine N(6)-hydroxylase/L-ornithine N(5)-oxygenase family protein n=1 Tax=Ralstonia solanacearum TaxID=305 RepID=UPI0004480002|nr:lysine N(6)-hydroxylase/L-ornithine N(5)-oxygenase family protein [Ralstonia solanacearum]AMP75747.1 siderophore biosynthesis protein [Ralstonia solanacearum]EUJ11912.1 siderophore biosynthesis protein [Ralstonia solanacearum P673]MCL9824274.1 lysine N(6)-hydroxylase/L-ornithine N(5)-oxygenase family protein [Ralstonia solanacearum]MCL9829493.1 lysine N(6)-hydroxylase/L-ornithine N(5)-oxygenase family protein [Ralstonia solanacearum]MCL9834274.1 lysine N(6)-hydroxylase/L-ornithine N(5)-oxyg